MAIIREFKELDLKAHARHTETQVGWSIQGRDDKKFIQINTVESSDRQIEGKVSQTLRLIKAAVEQLAALAKKHL